ncbi:MAG: choloylglycine hydrolase [Tyzzerella sp.]|nr:choloylglycine hydrolase [Tyzzerella sp.]
MCTAISCKMNDHYFGRNLDLEYSYEESVVITPRYFPFEFRKEREYPKHYAIIGVAYVKDNYPLYYDATNEKGLSMASLSFPGNAVYKSEQDDKYNVAPFEIIPWVLGQCTNVKEARELLEKTNIIKLAYNKELPLTALHFMIADSYETIVVEPLDDGLHIYENPVRVLTNNPTFPYHLHNLNNYMYLTKKQPVNHFAKELLLETYSRGMGAMGLPGDLSSGSRFVRAAFVKWNSLSGETEEENVSQFFHILGSVEQQKGCVQVEKGEYEFTVYSSCCNTGKGIYYYKTYHNSQITAVDMHKENMDGNALQVYPFQKEQNIYFQN